MIAVEKWVRFKKRADDNEDALKTRLMAYYKDTSPLIGYYYAKEQLQQVNGLNSIEKLVGKYQRHYLKFSKSFGIRFIV